MFAIATPEDDILSSGLSLLFICLSVIIFYKFPNIHKRSKFKLSEKSVRYLAITFKGIKKIYDLMKFWILKKKLSNT